MRSYVIRGLIRVEKHSEASTEIDDSRVVQASSEADALAKYYRWWDFKSTKAVDYWVETARVVEVIHDGENE